MSDFFQVGIITQTHGIKGEVKVFPTTDDVQRFKKLKKVQVELQDGKKELRIESVKFFKQFAILKFEGLDSINDVEQFKKKSLFVPREEAVPCKKDEYYIADLIAIYVVDENENEVGILKAVLLTGANDVYQIETTDGKELLLPAIKACILNVAMQSNKRNVPLLDGLLD